MACMLASCARVICPAAATSLAAPRPSPEKRLCSRRRWQLAQYCCGVCLLPCGSSFYLGLSDGRDRRHVRLVLERAVPLGYVLLSRDGVNLRLSTSIIVSAYSKNFRRSRRLDLLTAKRPDHINIGLANPYSVLLLLIVLR
jgi:hypothetical protein